MSQMLNEIIITIDDVPTTKESKSRNLLDVSEEPFTRLRKPKRTVSSSLTRTMLKNSLLLSSKAEVANKRHR